MAWVYMLRCSDGSFYVGMTRYAELGERLNEHAITKDRSAYIFSRRPFELVWSEWFDMNVDAMACERQIKGWSRAKKLALIDGDIAALNDWRHERETHPPSTTGLPERVLRDARCARSSGCGVIADRKTNTSSTQFRILRSGPDRVGSASRRTRPVALRLDGERYQ